MDLGSTNPDKTKKKKDIAIDNRTNEDHIRDLEKEYSNTAGSQPSHQNPWLQGAFMALQAMAHIANPEDQRPIQWLGQAKQQYKLGKIKEELGTRYSIRDQQRKFPSAVAATQGSPDTTTQATMPPATQSAGPVPSIGIQHQPPDLFDDARSGWRMDPKGHMGRGLPTPPALATPGTLQPDAGTKFQIPDSSLVYTPLGTYDPYSSGVGYPLSPKSKQERKLLNRNSSGASPSPDDPINVLYRRTL